MDATKLVTATGTAAMMLCTVAMPNGATYQLPCPTGIVGIMARAAETTIASVSSDDSSLTRPDASNDKLKFSDFRDPFYASTFPICYALAATTVTSWMLVIMLLVTPRSFLDGGIVYLGRRGGFTHSSAGSISIGGRPWLQKVAALTVAISLTIATADTFRVSQEQYTWGVQNAEQLQDAVLGSTEIKVIRLVSDTFLWLAQAQTLIRLFPRQREKVIIKWVAFALITLDLVFSGINSFLYSENGINSTVRNKNFVHPIPALSYLFELSLGLLYAAWVVYYALLKKRYAFYHPFMKNIIMVAIISIISLFIPVVFFILDISKPNFTAWGDYVRWVGAAAASVVVWEWVERIEALEREEKKDGILGREVFDGDDMLEVNAADFSYLKNYRNHKPGGSGSSGTTSGQDHSNNGGNTRGISAFTSPAWANVPVLTSRYRGQNRSAWGPEVREGEAAQGMVDGVQPPLWPSRPAAVVTPVSRTDTTSAASTLYAVRYQPPSDTTTRTPDPFPQQSTIDLTTQSSVPQNQAPVDDGLQPPQLLASVPNGHVVAPAAQRSVDMDSMSHHNQTRQSLASPNLSTRSNDDPQPQPQPEPVQREHYVRSDHTGQNRWDIKARLEEFAANQAEKLRGRMRTTHDTQSLPVKVIPAPPRRGAALQQVLEEEESVALTTQQQREQEEQQSQQQQQPSPSDLSNSPSNSHSNSYGTGGSSSSSRPRDGPDDIMQHDRIRSPFSVSQRAETPLSPNAPPLWRGIQSRTLYEDDYFSDDDDDEGDHRSISDMSSAGRTRQS